MNAKITHDCKDELKEINLKATPARLAVMKFLEQTKEPVDVSMIIEYLDLKGIKTDPATAFRIINILTDRGITTPISFHEDKIRYELANKIDHHHLICENCGRIEDIVDSVIPDFEKKIMKKQKFEVLRHSLEFFGLCHLCQR